MMKLEEKKLSNISKQKKMTSMSRIQQIKMSPYSKKSNLEARPKYTTEDLSSKKVDIKDILKQISPERFPKATFNLNKQSKTDRETNRAT
eukprot:CAMPEP_0170560868 /NCGR_PEP_ID=MMETSP0211-20121228/51550_1 /TAXON_ID=311385 /ORGANISM="Pseudokeronopsis sp., Strain OXSARD2" /LENGTH=89 /DNA_ID=CAMNT_0010875665 /DNA_START=117 /DNA_END=386 /DNA_ORIENTATION=-